MQKKEITTFVVTVNLNGALAHVVKGAIERALAEYGATLVIPLGWEPDPDTIAECAVGTVADDFDAIRVNVVDMNSRH